MKLRQKKLMRFKCIHTGIQLNNTWNDQKRKLFIIKLMRLTLQFKSARQQK